MKTRTGEKSSNSINSSLFFMLLAALLLSGGTWGSLLGESLITAPYSVPEARVDSDISFNRLRRPLPVLPEAIGFGIETVAGSGRQLENKLPAIMLVENVKDSGDGSLRACMQAAGPRTCIFSIAGTIRLKKRILVRHPFLTVAGQSAPDPGIHLVGAGIEIAAHDVLLQHMSIRPGDDIEGPDPGSRDAISVVGEKLPVYNVVLDHLSLSWAVDENFSTYGKVSDITISNCIIAEALHNSIHPKGPHGMGMLIGDGSQMVFIYRNLFISNNERNPRLKPGVSVVFANNLVYNWGNRGGWSTMNLSDTEQTGASTLLDFIGNVYLPGPDSLKLPPVFARFVSKSSKVYVASNFGPGRTRASEDEWSITSLPLYARAQGATLYPFVGEFSASKTELKREVLSSVGARPKDRNVVDSRLIEEVQSRVGSVKDCTYRCIRSAGGWPEIGEVGRSFYVPPHPHADLDGNGYTELEDALHQASNALQ